MVNKKIIGAVFGLFALIGLALNSVNERKDTMFQWKPKPTGIKSIEIIPNQETETDVNGLFNNKDEPEVINQEA